MKIYISTYKCHKKYNYLEIKNSKKFSKKISKKKFQKKF